MTNAHAAWAHLVGAGNALEDIAADASIPSFLRNKVAAIENKAGSSNILTKEDFAVVGAALIYLGENTHQKP